jgi:restriction endonuclease S subunit
MVQSVFLDNIEFYKETEFKDTEIGRIPKEWEVVKLMDVAGMRKNKTINRSGKIPFIPMELISNSRIYVEYEIRQKEQIKSSTYCKAGDLLLAKITPSLENGKQGIVPLDIPYGEALATTEVFPINCKNVDRFFLFYVLKFSKFRNVIISSMIGTTGRQRASKKAIEELMIIYPPLPEQQKIAEILSTIDKAIELTDKIIEDIERLKKGLMDKLLTEGVNIFVLEKDKIIDIINRLKDTKDLEHELSIYLKDKFPDYNIEVKDDLITVKDREYNLFAIVVKKHASIADIKKDIEKLEDIMLNNHKYCEAIFIGFDVDESISILSKYYSLIIILLQYQ